MESVMNQVQRYNKLDERYLTDVDFVMFLNNICLSIHIALNKLSWGGVVVKALRY
jgi:hypothetical protein